MGLETISREVRPDEAAWLAGILDGEGCFHMSLYKRNNYPSGKAFQVIIKVSNIDALIIHKISEIYKKINVGFHYNLWKRKNPKHHDALSITVGGMKSCRRVVNEVLPYLSGKKKQAEIMLEYINWRLDKKNFIHKKLLQGEYLPERPEVIGFVRKLGKAKKDLIDPSTTKRRAGEILKI